MPEIDQGEAFNFESTEARPRFPEKVEYVISPEEGLKVIQKALEDIKNYREDRLYIFKTIIGPLVPDNIRNKIENSFLKNLSFTYPSLVRPKAILPGSVLVYFILLSIFYMLAGLSIYLQERSSIWMQQDAEGFINALVA